MNIEDVYELFQAEMTTLAKLRFGWETAGDEVDAAFSRAYLTTLPTPTLDDDQALSLIENWERETKRGMKAAQNRETRRRQWFGTDDAASAALADFFGERLPNPERALLRKEAVLAFREARAALNEEEVALLDATKEARLQREEENDLRYGRALGTKNTVWRLGGKISTLLGYPRPGEEGYERGKQRLATRRQNLAKKLK